MFTACGTNEILRVVLAAYDARAAEVLLKQSHIYNEQQHTKDKTDSITTLQTII